MTDLPDATFGRYHSEHQRTCLALSIISIFTCIFLVVPWVVSARISAYSHDSGVYLSQPSDCSKANQTRIAHGREHFSQHRVIICGLLRDRESHIHRLRDQVTAIAQLFSDYAIVIVENDSKDGTRRELIRWANADPHVHVIGCDGQVNSNHSCNMSLGATQVQFLPKTSRIEKMVRLRNIYLNYIEQHPVLSRFDYVIVDDFDLTSHTYLDGFLSSGYYMSIDPSIDAICSNGIFHKKLLGNLLSMKTYFDPYAHKDDHNQNWSMAYNDIWSSLFRDYSCDDDLISVQSCFSGRTIYRYQSVQSKRYRTYLDQNHQAVCEHVGLHETLNKMYLNGRMILYITKNNV